MSETLTNTGSKLWSADDYNELWLSVFEELTGTGGKSNIRLIDEAIGKINSSLGGYYFLHENNRLYICKDNTESGATTISKLPVSLIQSDGKVASSVDGTTITIDKNGIVHGTTIDDAFSLTSENPVQNKVVKAKFDEVDEKIKANETVILSHTSNNNNPHNVTKSQVDLGNVENKSSETIRGEITKDNVTDALGYTPYTPNEVDNKLSTLETNIDWKESVATYDNIATTYPNPEDGWTVNVNDTNYTYRYNGTEWIPVSANAIPKSTDSVDGLLSKEDHAKYKDANSKKHTHDNKSSLDKLGESAEGNLTFNGKEIKAAQMTGATSTTDGVSGTVPAPIQGQEEYVLKGDGTWGKNVKIDSELSTESSNALMTSVAATKFNKVDESISSLNTDLTQVRDAICSDAWNGSTVYSVGDYVIYNNSLWKCLVQNSGQEPSEGTYWTKCSISKEIFSLNTRFKFSSGQYTPTLISGGDSISLSNAYWYKMGNLVQICILTWGSPITNPNDDNVAISLPFRAISIRNYGITGYNDSGIEFHPAISGQTNSLYLIKRVNAQEVSLKGTGFPNKTFQFSIMYFTDE